MYVASRLQFNLLPLLGSTVQILPQFRFPIMVRFATLMRTHFRKNEGKILITNELSTFLDPGSCLYWLLRWCTLPQVRFPIMLRFATLTPPHSRKNEGKILITNELSTFLSVFSAEGVYVLYGSQSQPNWLTPRRSTKTVYILIDV